MSESYFFARKKKTPKRTGSLASLADVLPTICDRLDLDKKVNELAFLALWPKQVEAVAGKAAAENSRAVRLKKQGVKTVLLVRVAQAALSSELSFQVVALKEGLNRFAPQTGLTVDTIQFVVGSL